MRIKKLMQILLVLSITTIINSCCSRKKCQETRLGSAFKIIDIRTGEDLLFGSNRRFNPYTIKMYSVAGIDTIFHNTMPGKYTPPPDLDSLLFTGFDYEKFETVFIQLTNSDIDTLTVNYGSSDGGACCSDVYWIKSIDYNNQRLLMDGNQSYIIKK